MNKELISLNDQLDCFFLLFTPDPLFVLAQKFIEGGLGVVAGLGRRMPKM